MGGGVEEVEVLARHADLDVLVDTDARPRAEPGHGVGDTLAEELLGRVRVTGVDPLGVGDLEVDHQLGPERLDEAHRGLQAAIGRSVGDDGGVLEVLGADADHHALAVVALQGRVLLQRLGGERHPLGADLHALRRR